jgi:hypothetical protein
MSPSGGPPTASTPRTADQPDRNNSRPPSRNAYSALTALSPTPAMTQSVSTGGMKSRPGPSRIVGDSAMTGRSRPRSVRGRPDLPGRPQLKAALSPVLGDRPEGMFTHASWTTTRLGSCAAVREFAAPGNKCRDGDRRGQFPVLISMRRLVRAGPHLTKLSTGAASSGGSTRGVTK